MPHKSRAHQLDNKISQLQANLFDLYRQRQELFGADTDYPAALRAATTFTTASADEWYDRLQLEWQARNVAIPAKAQLLNKIKSGLVVIEQLASELTVSADLFRLVLVPPAKIYSDAKLNNDRASQEHIRYSDQYDSPKPRTRQTDWKLIAVYDGLEGLDFGSAAEILTEQTYLVNGLDTRALGPREYAIYALSHRGRRDASWMWLLKDASEQAWSVRLFGGAYRYTLDDLEGFGQGELFRPAVEIA